MITPAQDATLAVQLVVTDTGGAEAASSGVASVQVQLAWQHENGDWQAGDWVQASAGAEGVYTATVAACTSTWRVPHNRPLRISLHLRDNAGNQAYDEAAAVLRYVFPDLNRDCIVEIKDVFDLLPALRDGVKVRPEHDVDGDGSVTAADGTALLAAIYGSAQPAAMPIPTRTAQGAAAGIFGLPGSGSIVQFTPLSTPTLSDGVRDVALLNTALLLTNWRTNDMPLIEVGKTLEVLLLTPLLRSGSGYGVTTDGSLVYAAGWEDADLTNIGVWDLSQPLTPTLVTTITLPGEVMESAVISGQLYAAAGYAGLHLVDVTTLPTATLLSTLDTPGMAADVSVADGLVYVADGMGGLRIYSTADAAPTTPITFTEPITPLAQTMPLSPTLLATFDTPGDAIGVTAVLSTVYVADGLGGVRIVDAGDPASPRLLAAYATASAANSTVVSGTTLFVAAGWEGVLALDISDPTAPHLASSFDTPGYAYDLALAGDLLLVADGPGGLQALRVEQEAAPAHYLLIPFVAK